MPGPIEDVEDTKVEKELLLLKSSLSFPRVGCLKVSAPVSLSDFISCEMAGNS